jgi:IclR family acetate operon transcriptional repressor
VKAVGKALDVLERIAAGEVTTARDVVTRLRVPRSTAHRMLAELLDLELVQRVGERLVIGPRITRLAGGRVGSQRLVSVAQPEMIALRDRCRETVGLHVLEGGRRVLLYQAESTHEHRWVYTNPGQPMPLHAGAASKMLLAMLPEEEASGLLDRNGLPLFTPHTPRDAARLMREVRRIRRDGHAISREEVTPGIASIAVPLGTGDDATCAVLSVTGPTVRLTASTLERIRPQLRETAVGISRALVPGTPGSVERTARGTVPAGGGVPRASTARRKLRS